jgi:hypothetical protein
MRLEDLTELPNYGINGIGGRLGNSRLISQGFLVLELSRFVCAISELMNSARVYSRGFLSEFGDAEKTIGKLLVHSVIPSIPKFRQNLISR